MAINQISTANTFEQWLIATQSLIAFANSITNSAPGTTFTSNTSEYVITGNLTVGNTVTCVTMNTDVIIFNDGTRLDSNVQIVNAYAHSNAAFNKANAANVLAQQAYDYANTIAISGEIAGDNVQVLYAVIGNTINANISMSTANITVTSNVTTSNIVASNNVTVTKNVAAGNVVVTNSVSAANISATSNVSAGNVVVTNAISGTNITLTNNVSTGNITVTNDITTTNVTATLVSATDFNTTSDVALKTNMQQITNSLDVIEQLTGFVFNWKSDGKTSYGVSAQQVEQILPDLVRMRDDGFKGVNYLNLIAFLIEAIKDLKKDVSKIKNHININ
jgi:hypothetical protein